MSAARTAFHRYRRRLAWRAVHGLWNAAQRAGAITADTPAGQAFAAFGAGSIIGFPTGARYGERWIEIGTGTMIAAQVSLSAGMVPGQDLGHSIVIGDDVYTGPYVYITDQNHGYADPDIPIGRQWPSNAAVSVGSGTWLGAGVIVLPGAVIGRNVVVAAGSVVRGTVPDCCVIAGVPARVVREYVTGNGWTRRAPAPEHHR